MNIYEEILKLHKDFPVVSERNWNEIPGTIFQVKMLENLSCETHRNRPNLQSAIQFLADGGHVSDLKIKDGFFSSALAGIENARIDVYELPDGTISVSIMKKLLEEKPFAII